MTMGGSEREDVSRDENPSTFTSASEWTVCLGAGLWEEFLTVEFVAGMAFIADKCLRPKAFIFCVSDVEASWVDVVGLRRMTVLPEEAVDGVGESIELSDRFDQSIIAHVSRVHED